jgi:transposase InsO family protein
MNVSTSGYYEWLCNDENPRIVHDMINAQHIREIFEKHRGIYGARRIQQELLRRGIHLGRKKISSLMAMGGMISYGRRRRRVSTTDSKHNLLISENLVNRGFTQAEPNRVWVTDTTYIATKEGWLYLTTMLDLYSRRIVGWAMADKIDADLAVQALNHAVENRKPAPGLIVHSDRGSQFASHAFRDALAKAKALSSMSGKGDCFDNACAESFFHSLKGERLEPHGIFATRGQARAEILAYLLYYNRTRLHSYLGYITPCDFEKLRNLKIPYDLAS